MMRCWLSCLPLSRIPHRFGGFDIGRHPRRAERRKKGGQHGEAYSEQDLPRVNREVKDAGQADLS